MVHHLKHSRSALPALRSVHDRIAIHVPAHRRSVEGLVMRQAEDLKRANYAVGFERYEPGGGEVRLRDQLRVEEPMPGCPEHIWRPLEAHAVRVAVRAAPFDRPPDRALDNA